MAEFWIGPADAPDTYRLVSLLGGGGEGEVWKAVLPLSADGRRHIAVKMCPAREDADQFQRFGHLLRSLSHPGLVRVTDAFRGPAKHRRGEAPSSPDEQAEFEYVIMDHVEGATLREWVVDNPQADVSQRLRLLGMVAAALDEMHSGTMTDVAVAHGDVKPANIVVRPDGSAVLVDLGLACLEDDNGRRGRSAAYAAPELRETGARATPAADRYAFAVTTAHLLTGVPPPLDSSDALDVGALRRQLAASPLTARRHTLAHRIAAMIDAEPEARTGSLRPWLDSTIDSLSQLTDTGPADDRRVAAPAVAPGRGQQTPPSRGQPASSRGTPPTARQDGRGVLTAKQHGSWRNGAPPMNASRRPGSQRLDPRHPQLATREDGAMDPNYVEPYPVEPYPAPRPRPKLLYALIAAVVAALVVSGVIIIPKLVHPSQSEIFAEPANSAGDNPFARGLTLPQAPPISAVNTPPTTAGATPNIQGDTPGLYAGVQGTPAYDTTELASQIQSDSQKSQAWSSASNVLPSTIGSYLKGTTPLYLTGTIQVTFYTYANGTFVAQPALLQVGTLVLVNKYGVPVVRVIGGNPLTAPTPIVGSPIYVGQLWPGFNPNSVFVIAPSSQAIGTLVVYDPVTGQLFNLPFGVFTPVAPMQQVEVPAPPVAAPPQAHAPVVGPPVDKPAIPVCGENQWRDSDGDCHNKERPKPRCGDGEHIHNGECVENGPPRVKIDPPRDPPPDIDSQKCRPGAMVSDGECGSTTKNSTNNNCNKSCGRRNNNSSGGEGGCFAIVNGRNQGVPCHH
jgi:serine/threonine protein kinase